MTDQPKTGSGYTVRGRITDVDGHPVAGATVHLFLRTKKTPEHPVGAPSVTDAQGRYSIALSTDEAPPGLEPKVYIQVQGEGEPGESDWFPLLQWETVIDVELGGGDPGHPGEHPLRVYGTVRDKVGELMDGVTVEAYDRDMRSEELLGSCVAKQGRYEIRYTADQFARSEKASADLVMRVLGANREALLKTPVRFNVPDELEWNLTLADIAYQGPSEWDVLSAELTPLLDGVSPLDLREDDRFQDITFLSGETGRTQLAIGIWIGAQRLAEKTRREEVPLAAEALYAFLRQGQPSIYVDSLLEDLNDPATMVLLEDQALRALAELLPETQKSLLTAAITGNLVPTRVEPAIPAVLATLQRIKQRYTGDTVYGDGKGTIGDLLDLTPVAAEHKTAFLAAFSSHTGPLEDFWKKVADDQVLPPASVPEVRLTFELGGLVRNHVPLVGALADRFADGRVKSRRDLAKFSTDTWSQVLQQPGRDGTPIGVPADTQGNTPEEKRKAYAAVLDRQFEMAFPTASFAGKLGRAHQLERRMVSADAQLVHFLDHNGEFELDRYRVDHYIKETPGALDGIADPPALLADLKSVQRVFKLNPTYTTANTLLGLGLDSAQAVYFLGEGQFTDAVGGSPAALTGILADRAQATTTTIDAVAARRLYRKAESTYAQALTVYSDYNLAFGGHTPFALPRLTPDAAAAAKIATLPNLRTLFGSLDYCECSPCRSVHSPAAYFVDVVRFLGQRGTQGSGQNAGKSVRDVLLERRPDLGALELSCENTDTPLPYIDLVNEVLEDVVSPPVPVLLNPAVEPELGPGTISRPLRDELAAHGVRVAADALVYAQDSRGRWTIRDTQHAYTVSRHNVGDRTELRLLPSRQTFASAGELRANPEYTNRAAYDRLRQEIFPLDLPFDLAHLQTRTYLEHLGVPHPRLLELLQRRLSNGTPAPTDTQIDCAWLGLTETRRLVVTGQLPGRQPWEYWGLAETGNDLPDPDNPADPTHHITGGWIDVLGHVPVLLNRTGLAYTELLQLLDTHFVNPAGNLRILGAGEGTAAECDTSAFTVRGLDAGALDRVHRFIRLWRDLGCTMWELDLLLPPPDNTTLNAATVIDDRALRRISVMLRLRRRLNLDWLDVRSLYEGIDNTPYRDRGRSGAPAVQTQYQRLFRNRLVDAVADFPADPAEITGTVAERVPGILAAFRIKEADLQLILADLGLTGATTLDLWVLGRIHRVTVLAKALRLTVDQFLRLVRLWDDDPFSYPQNTATFTALADQVAASQFSPADLDYLLAHRVTPNSGIALDGKAVTELLLALRDGLEKIETELRIKDEETDESYVRAKLGLLPRLAADADQTTALTLVDGTWQGAPAQRDPLIDAFFAGVLDQAGARARFAALPGGLTPAQRQQQVDARFGYLRPALEAFLLRTRREDLVCQQTAGLLRIETPSATVLLGGLHLPGTTSPLLANVDDPRLLERLPGGGYRFTLTEADFPAAFQALRLLHKDALVIGRLRMTAGDVEWWLGAGHAAGLGWMHPGDFPVGPSAPSVPVPLTAWTALVDFFGWRGSLPAADLTALDFAGRVLDPAVPSSANLADLAELTGWDRADIDTLVTAFRWLDPATGLDIVKARLADPVELVRLADVAAALRRLGVSAARALGWAVAEPDADSAESLKQTVKAKYDLSQWQEVIRPVQDVFRARKRQALVHWLAAHPDPAQGQNWTDATGLYSFFLIDVEMSACMLTSRLKQASASAQLFVQRCLLNLEVDIRADSGPDPRWKQWTWMKRYRVWEANRKVFLYPENWLEPELRGEKSPLFQGLEQELMQNEVTGETCDEAFRNYVENLDKVANLEIRAVFAETVSVDENYLHVFGRSRSSQGAEYFYRRQVNGSRWTPWEKVDQDISANHLVAAVFNRRVHLMWPQFQNKAAAPDRMPTPGPDSSADIQAPDRWWEVRMFWTELKKGRWTPKVLSDAPVTVQQDDAGGDYPQNIALRTRQLPYGIRTQLHVGRDLTRWAPVSTAAFEKLGRQLSARQGGYYYEHLVSPAQSHFHNGLIRHDTPAMYFSYNSVNESGFKSHVFPAHNNAQSIWLASGIEAGETYSVIDSSAADFPSLGTYFMWDSRHSYQVVFDQFQWWWGGWWGGWGTWQFADFRFAIHYHPFVELFVKEVNAGGVKGLLNRRIQIAPQSVPGSPPLFDFATYQPSYYAPGPWPVEDVDFTYKGAYSPYNWELFFHAPLMIAQKLAANQHFEEALEWFHSIFDPTSTDTSTPDPATPQQKFWVTKPFYETTTAQYYAQKIESIMLAIAQGDTALRAQVAEWRNNPFDPHLIARMRTVAYQKNVLIKYVQTLVAWADQLFGQDTIETVNEATQLYILAASVLGPRPRSVPKNVPNPVKTYYQLQTENIDDFGNALVQIENLLPDVPAGGIEGDQEVPELPHLDVLYFCVPNNENLLALWDTVEDRLFKVRHCMDLQGNVRSLPLFEPPLDPGALIRAVAGGADAGTALADLNAPLPLYRFSFAIQRAQEMCDEVKSLGAAMLSALEKRDTEAMALLRSTHEQDMLAHSRLVKASRIDEETRTKESLDESKKVIEARRDHYKKLLDEGWNGWEKTWLGLTVGAMVLETAGTVLNLIASPMAVIPTVNAGVSGFGGSPLVSLTLGGEQVASSLGKTADALKGAANVAQMGAGMTSTIGSYERRAQEWDLQYALALQELAQVEKQIAAATVRIHITEQELAQQDKQIENAAKEDEFLRSKFSSRELYDWTVGQLSTLFFQSYQLSYDLAKRAERCFRYELGLAGSDYIQFGYWDSLKKGLLSGERLSRDLRRLESAYYEQNRREYELTKHISLAQLDPVALLRLRQNGECFIDIPETAFDMDYPGQYFRRLKTVGLSIPCVAGPATTIACTLTLTSNHLRKDSTLLAGAYARDLASDDPRFRDEVGAVQSIATSSAQDDQGLFELSFRDERYLPFEGAGAISSWHVRLNKDLPQFDFDTISDVVLHLRFTAREGGALLRSKAAEEFAAKLNEAALAENRRGLFRVVDLKREYPDAWYRFLHPGSPADDQQFVLGDLPDRLPYFTRAYPAKKATRVEVVARMKDTSAYKALLSPLGTAPADLLDLVPDPTYQGLHRAARDLTGNEIALTPWTLKLRAPGATDYKSLPPDSVDELFLVINYTIA